MSIRYLQHNEVEGYLSSRRDEINESFEKHYIKGTSSENVAWVWWFYLGSSEIIEILEYTKIINKEIKHNGEIYTSSGVVRVKTGLIKSGSFKKYGKLFEDMTEKNYILPVEDIHQELGITKEEEEALLEILNGECKSAVDEFDEVSLENAKSIEERMKDIHRAYS